MVWSNTPAKEKGLEVAEGEGEEEAPASEGEQEGEK